MQAALLELCIIRQCNEAFRGPLWSENVKLGVSRNVRHRLTRCNHYVFLLSNVCG